MVIRQLPSCADRTTAENDLCAFVSEAYAKFSFNWPWVSFRRLGIYPYDRNIFKDECCATSDVTERQLLDGASFQHKSIVVARGDISFEAGAVYIGKGTISVRF